MLARIERRTKTETSEIPVAIHAEEPLLEAA
jgi:hypothetical protein